MKMVITGIICEEHFANEKIGERFGSVLVKKDVLPSGFNLYYEKHNNNPSDLLPYEYAYIAYQGKNIPKYPIYTPVKITGYFKDKEKADGYSKNFIISHIEPTVFPSVQTLFYFLRNYLKVNDCKAVAKYVNQNYKNDLFAFISSEKSNTVIEKIHSMTSLNKENAAIFYVTLNNFIIEREFFNWLEQFDPLNIYSATQKGIYMYGKNAIDRLKDNPYLYGDNLELSFSVQDKIAFSLGWQPGHLERRTALLKESIKRVTNSGSTYANLGEFKGMFSSISISKIYPNPLEFTNISPELGNLVGAAMLDNQPVIFSTPLMVSEKRIAENIYRLSDFDNKLSDEKIESIIKKIEEKSGLSYGKDQKNAIITGVKPGVNVITGGPGTGKTFTVAGILKVFNYLHKDAKIKLFAPTGRAAQRLSESTKLEATTMHKGINYIPYGDEMSAQKNSEDPIDADLIVIDEASMIDINLFDLFLEAVANGTTLILVGDTDQLESVGPGAILRDLLNSSDSLVHKAELKEVHRQGEDSPIVENAIRTRRKQTKMLENENFKVYRTKSEEETLNKIIEVSKQYFDPKEPFDCQVLCPTRKGKAGIDSSNKYLQKLHNGGHKPSLYYGNKVFKVDDKVIMIRNNYEAGYFNGDIGIIENIIDSILYIRIRDELFEIEGTDVGDVALAYSMTIHKSQGSEFKNTIVVLNQWPKCMLVRNLYYTGITRGKERVIVITEENSMEKSIVTDKTENRKTLLKYFLDVEAEKIS